MSAEVGSVKYRVELDDSTLDQETKKTESKLAAGFKGAAGAVGAAALSAAAAGTAAVVGLVKDATAAYGEYEQLVGGVETLFGDSAQVVMDNAAKAFNSAGMSMNDYMETSIQSAASLINSLEGDTAEAARLMDVSVTDMADNVNKMGTSMEAVQNAYRGFSRGNFTMLDNLALGFSGTKEGMQELLDQAQKISGIEYDISSYADIVQAIHVVQEEMGIAGTTAKEASDTFQGSFSAMQAAWQNLVTGMADPEADVGALVGQMVDSAETFLENLIPIIEHALLGISDAVASLAPIIAEKLPALTEEILPDLLNTGMTVIEIFAKGLIDAAPTLLPTVTDLILNLASMLLSLAPEILQVGLQLIGELAMGIAQALPELVPVAIETILSLVEFLVDPDNIGMLVDAAIALTMGLAEGLINALPVLLEKAPLIVEKLITSLIENSAKLNVAAVELVIKLATGIWEQAPKIVEAAWKIIGALIEGIGKQFVKIYDTGGKIIEKIKEGLSKLNPLQWGKDVIDSFVKGILGAIDKVKETAKKVAQTVKDFLGFSEPEEGPLSNFHTFAPDMIDLYTKGIDDGRKQVEDSAAALASSVALGFDADVNYSVPDIAGYARDLSASITGTGRTVIEVPVVLDGREIARASAWYMGEQLAWEAR
ncbi:MAG: hypothetical protein IKF99_09495 [Oscillospiraceae bacterium]|nr:hypothetical protein [Oscillospiraceae bacterium]